MFCLINSFDTNLNINIEFVFVSVLYVHTIRSHHDFKFEEISVSIRFSGVSKFNFNNFKSLFLLQERVKGYFINRGPRFEVWQNVRMLSSPRSIMCIYSLCCRRNLIYRALLSLRAGLLKYRFNSLD